MFTIATIATCPHPNEYTSHFFILYLEDLF